MIRRKMIQLCALALLVGSAAPVFAHHSQSQYDPDKVMSIEGTLKQGSWSNPHTLFVIVGKPVGTNDAPQEWTVEGPGPRQLEQKGWGKGASKAGDKLTFEGRPRRDGQPELLLTGVTLADGKAISFKPE
jgi:hypothetical protein